MTTSSDLRALFSSKTLLIFDFDGTIADSSPIHARAFNEAFASYGVTVDYSTVAGLPTDAAVDRIVAEAGLVLHPTRRTSIIAKKREVARRIMGAELTPLDGSIPFLRHVGKSYNMALCTSGSRATIEMSLQKLKIATLFEPIITADDVANGKPAPEGFIKALRYFNVPAEQALVLEDAESGLAAAAAAGIEAIHVVPNGDVRKHPLWGTWPMLNQAVVG